MFKALGRIGKDRLKFNVEFSAKELSIKSNEDCYIKLTV